MADIIHLTTADPLMQLVRYGGQEYFTSQYFHRQYLATNMHEGHVGKYRQHAHFRRLLTSIEAYPLYVEGRDIVEIYWQHVKPLKDKSDPIFGLLEPLFLATRYQPLTLLNKKAQIALSHHLDDELSKQIAYTANTVIAHQIQQSPETIPEEAKRTLEVRQYAARLIEADKRLDALFGIPEHVTLTESVKSIRQLIGVDFSEKLLSSPKMDNIQEEHVYLEIRELQQRFGLKHGELNPLLARRGWQTRLAPGQWEPTRQAQEMGYCSRHAWAKGGKSGINWKWQVPFIETELQAEGIA